MFITNAYLFLLSFSFAISTFVFVCYINFRFRLLYQLSFSLKSNETTVY